MEEDQTVTRNENLAQRKVATLRPCLVAVVHIGSASHQRISDVDFRSKSSNVFLAFES